MRVDRLPLSEFQLERVPPGERRAWWLDALPTPAGTLSIPAMVARGARPGRTLMAVAGVHGDEFEGMAAIREVFAELDPAAMAGAFCALPVCNPWAFEAHSRTTPAHVDGLNMARVFPGDPAGEPTRRLAAALLDLVRRNLGTADLFIDFHSSGTRYRYLPMIGYVDVEGGAAAASREATRRFGIDLLWELPPTPAGRFNTEVARLGIPTLGTETNGQGACRDEDVAQYAEGLRRMLRHLGIVEGPPPPVNPREPARIRHLYMPESGFFRPRRGLQLGDPLREGELIGIVSDPFGRVRAEVRSPAEARLVAIRTFSATWAGDIAALIHPGESSESG